MLSSRTTGGVVAINLLSAGSQYTAAPTVSLSGGGGTGCTAICHMAGTRVESVVIVNQGTGYTSAPTVTLNAATGSGATAEAKVYAGSFRPMNFFQGRFGDVYGVDGMGRGIRWDNSATTAEPIGLAKPAIAPAVTGGTTAGQYVRDVVIVRQGGGYVSEPSVTISGGSPATNATGRAVMVAGRVAGVKLTERGGGYQATPKITFSGGIGESSLFNVGVSGKVRRIDVVDGGEGYSTRPPFTATPAIGVTASSTGDYIESPGHGFSEDDEFYFSSVSGFTGFATESSYYAVSVNATQFKAATAAGGTPITISTAISSGVVVDPSRHLYINIQNHGLTTGSTVSLSSISGGSGLSEGVAYYATSVNATQFKVATTSATTAYPVVFVSAVTSGYATIPPPRLQFATGSGLSGANANVIVSSGRISSVSVLAAGTGATTAATATVVGGAGTGGSVSPVMDFSVISVTAATSGSGYYAAPIITIQPAAGDPGGSGASATATVNESGQITEISVGAGGSYSEPPNALILDTTAEATPVMSSYMKGKYLCAIRYIDDTPRTRRGPVVSSISETTEVDAVSGYGSLVWSFSHAAVDDRVYAMELWRSTADQATVLFRVATILRTDPAWSSGYEDTLSDPELVDKKRDDYGILPVTLPSGQINARRFGVPPGSMAVGVMFQDRAWYAVDTTGERANSLFFSEVDEPESVPPLNELVVQQNIDQPDRIRALVPLGTDLLIAQDAHLYKLNYVAQPVIDASISLVGYRGVLNERCWSVMGGVAFLVDSVGMYAFDGSSEQPVSVQVDNYWRDGIIDLSQSESFHVSSDFDTRTVRFHYCQPGDAGPVRALCYCVATQAWWEEQYPEAITASAKTLVAGRYMTLTSAGGSFHKPDGVTDQDGSSVEYRTRTGNFPLTQSQGGDRTVSVVYRPTSDDSELNLRLHYNNSLTPRRAAISSDPGSGFSTSGGTQATLNMKLTRSSLGDAVGQASAGYAGRVDPKSAGADKHIAAEIAGAQAGTAGNSVVIHSINIQGAG